MAGEPETRLGGCGPGETAGKAGNVRRAAPGARSRAGGRAGPRASSARMRNKAAGQARVLPARPAGGLSAGRGGGREARPAGPEPVGSWPPLGDGVRSAWALRWLRGPGLHPPPCFGDRSCPPRQVGQPPSRSFWRTSPGCPPACPSLGGLRRRRPSGEVGRPRGRVAALVQRF